MPFHVIPFDTILPHVISCLWCVHAFMHLFTSLFLCHFTGMEKTICVLRPHRNITGGHAFDVGPGKGNTCSCTGQRLQRAYNAAKKNGAFPDDDQSQCFSVRKPIHRIYTISALASRIFWAPGISNPSCHAFGLFRLLSIWAAARLL